MSHKIFRIFNPGGPKEDPIDKRRAQLRNAQRSYRDRKDKYTKALEREVAQIRANEAELMTRCEQLSATVQALTELLAQHGIMTPPTLEKNTNDGLSNKRRNPADVVTEDNLSQSSITSSTLCTSGLSHDTTMTTLTKTPAEVRSPFQTGYIGNADKPKPQSYRYSSEYHRLLKRSWSEIDQALLGSDNSRGRMCELDPTLVGMEFVLT
ncbi:hypothetical protein CT0861_02986 [Colletotrichum tofieldiae]|uniref:BZIP domain-containing protein n=1 Tax=Colletotrichum tofieldiae TaxID=708197 RepID=A0A166NXA2_9PEZI|nr:hypothetical protein CT0861_02986 [Colletotrichum tofieldiae]